MKNAFILAVILHSITAFAQPATEIYLFDLSINDEGIELSNPKNISNHTGYDNQPFFLHDGSLLFVSAIDGQTEVIHFINGENKRLTNTPGGEYSPTPMPDKEHFSTILLEPDGTQLLWKYKLDGSDPEILIPELKIGYHAWANDHVVVSYVLGTPSTLQMTDIPSLKSEVVAYQVGRSISRIPGSGKISFIQTVDGDPAEIKSFDPDTKEIVPLVLALEGSQDYAWAANKMIFMGQGSKLYVWQMGQKFWKEIINLQSFGLDGITRMSVSPFIDKIAIVVAEQQSK